MKDRNKIFSLIFLFIFLISNTGLPLSLHLCQMMKKVSMDSCDMCSTAEIKKSCCTEVAGQTISREMSSCCQTKVVAEPLKDSFLSFKENILSSIEFSVIDELILSINPGQEFSFIEITGSPPYSHSPDLYLLNSSFLI